MSKMTEKQKKAMATMTSTAREITEEATQQRVQKAASKGPMVRVKPKAKPSTAKKATKVVKKVVDKAVPQAGLIARTAKRLKKLFNPDENIREAATRKLAEKSITRKEYETVTGQKPKGK
jgi:hypothetical protein